MCIILKNCQDLFSERKLPTYLEYPENCKTLILATICNICNRLCQRMNHNDTHNVTFRLEA